MSTAVSTLNVSIPSLLMDEAELMSVLKNSLYPGVQDATIKLIIGYCRAQNLDPMQKPVHAVPMSVKSGKKDANGDDLYETRDVILPGIGLYRTQAARTQQYAGISEPEFGPVKTLTYKKKVMEWNDGPNGRTKTTKNVDTEVEYPEWCRITVVRFVGGVACEFPAKEYWLENYATQSKWTTSPNAMWERRPYAQLAKCAEAQALRKGFPEIGSNPTAEEMEGKSLDVEPDLVPAKASLTMPAASNSGGTTIDSTATEVKEEATSQKAADARVVGVGEKKYLEGKLKAKGVAKEDAMKACGLTDWDNLTVDGFQVLKEWVLK